MTRYLGLAILISLFLVVGAQAVELFRYTLTVPDGREFEYVFETDEEGVLPGGKEHLPMFDVSPQNS
jgi:hypothetical protein